MTDFVGGYTPGKLTAETTCTTPLDTVKVTFTAPDGVGDWSQELYDAIAAGQAAVKASLEASFTGHTAYPGAIQVFSGKTL